jgi:hypothetical protein
VDTREVLLAASTPVPKSSASYKLIKIGELLQTKSQLSFILYSLNDPREEFVLTLTRACFPWKITPFSIPLPQCQLGVFSQHTTIQGTVQDSTFS